MRTKLLVLLFGLFTATVGNAQQNFRAVGTGASISTHFNYGTTPYTQLDTKISTSTNPVGGNGLTSPAMVVAIHVNGKDYAINPDAGVVGFGGSFQFGTGSLLSGNVADTAVFGNDGSYVTIGSNGACGIFKADLTCKNNGFTPNTATLFVGVFVGHISWATQLDGTHVIKGTVYGIPMGNGQAVYLSFTAVTAADPAPFVGNGHLNVTTVTVENFNLDQD